MKTHHIASLLVLLPLLIVFLLAAGGLFLNIWVYIILSIVCPLAACITWFIYKDMGKKLSDSERDLKSR